MTKPKVNPPVVVTEDCIGCRRCVEICPSFVLEMVQDKAEVVRGDWCIGCGHCGGVCPAGAIVREGTRFEDHPKKGEEPATPPGVLELLLRERRSVRCYTRDPVPEEILNRILAAGSYAPTGSNSQNVHYIVLKSPEQLSELNRMTLRFYDRVLWAFRSLIGRMVLSLLSGRKTLEYLKESLPKVEYGCEQIKKGKDRLFYHAPVVVLAHAKSWDTSSPFNCSVALYNCSLMAHALGLGCCFNGILVNAANHSARIKRWLDIPADHKCYSAMTLGFSDVKYPHLVRRRAPQVAWHH